MSYQWPCQDSHQARQEFAKKEKALQEGILVLIEKTVYHFADKKEWTAASEELLKVSPNHYAWTNLSAWHEWLRERDKS